MNSTALQKQFPEVYRDFFSKNDLVVSGCFSMPWWNEGIIHQSKYAITRSKIPLKCYIWIKKSSNKKIEFSDVTFFDSPKNASELFDYGKIIKEKVVIEKILQERFIKNDDSNWVVISMLSEIPRWHSFGFSDTSFAILSSALSIFYWELDIKILEDYKIFEASKQFEEIANFGWKLSLISRYWNTISQNIRSTLSGSSSPQTIYCEEFTPETKDINETIEIHVLSNKNADNRELSLDYWVIFTGIETNSKQIEEIHKDSFFDFEEYLWFMEEKIGSDKRVFLNSLLKKDLLTDIHEKMLSFLSIKTSVLLQKIYSSGLDFRLIEDFIEHINNQRKFLSIISQENHFAEEFYFIFRKLRKNSLEDIGILPIYSSKLWGWCVFVMKPGISRDTLDKTLQEMRTFYPNAEIEYCSYMDGNSHNGIKVEQFITGWVYSQYIQKNQVLYKNNLEISYISTMGDILEKENSGILVDTISRKIYINWTRLTSKEIPAQNTTSELLSILFEKRWQDVSSKELPNSSYASNKNEMLGKIVIPLVKIVKDTFDIDFPFICKWSINDFYLKLNDTSIKIGIIQNI